MPNLIVYLAVGLVIIAVVLIAIKQVASNAAPENAGAADGKDYALRPAILSPAERSFLGVLESLLPEDVEYLTKVRLGDVFTTKQGLDGPHRTRARNRINQKHVDFLLVRASDLKPLAGIELDDASHEAEARQRRDAFVDSVFQSCKIPLLHVPARATYNLEELRTTITAMLARGEK